MLDYLVKVLLFQTLFLVAYDLILKKETFFQWNRSYLIATSILAYLIPIIKIEKVTQAVSQEYTVILPEVILSPQSVIKEQFDWSGFLFSSLKTVFWVGVLIATILFLIKLFKIIQLVRLNDKENVKDYWLVFLEHRSPFSFFRYIFLNKEVSEKDKALIIKHELVHVKQKHSLDLLFFELQRILFWFNPFSYSYQNRIAELHEFIADSIAIKSKDKTAYFQNLLNTTFNTNSISFINPFFKHSLIKKRIVMLNKQPSKQLLKFKYLLLLPLLAGMLLYSSCEKEEEIIVGDKSSEELINELKTKSDKKELSQEEIQDLMEIISRSIVEEGSDRQKYIKEQLYLYLIKKREEMLANSNSNDEIDKNEDSIETRYENLPFAIVDKAPVFPGCENTENIRECFQKNISSFIANKMIIKNKPDITSGQKRIYVRFVIDEFGKVINIEARGPHEELETAAAETIKMLPRMTPAQHKGKEVSIKYTLPITIKIP